MTRLQLTQLRGRIWCSCCPNKEIRSVNLQENRGKTRPLNSVSTVSNARFGRCVLTRPPIFEAWLERVEFDDGLKGKICHQLCWDFYGFLVDFPWFSQHFPTILVLKIYGNFMMVDSEGIHFHQSKRCQESLVRKFDFNLLQELG